MTNKEWLAGLEAEEAWEKLEKVLDKIGITDKQTKLALMVWMEDNHVITREEHIAEMDRQLKAYRQRLEDAPKVYQQTFSVYAANQRKSRELALGACALKALDAVRELRMGKDLLAGTLDYIISEQKVKDTDKKKGFLCEVTYHVASSEQAHSAEDIDKEIETTREKMMRETDEMFPEEKKSEEKKSDKKDV